MKKSRLLLIAAQVLAVVLFIEHAQRMVDQSHEIGFWIPLGVVLLMVINSFWFTRFVSWLIFAVSFFSFCVALSAFTLRWRLESGFNAMPFYKAILMYVVFVYVGLGQLKILGGSK